VVWYVVFLVNILFWVLPCLPVPFGTRGIGNISLHVITIINCTRYFIILLPWQWNFGFPVLETKGTPSIWFQIITLIKFSEKIYYL
jgi:hypothetical protein